MKTLKAIATICLFFVSLLCQAQSIHFIIVTKDDALGSVKDKATMLTEIEKIGRQTGMQVKLYEYLKQDTNIGEAIRRVHQEAQSEDVVWFYYSGDGINSGDGWGTFSNSAGRFDMTEVHNLMNNISCRLKITMYDASNVGMTNQCFNESVISNTEITPVDLKNAPNVESNKLSLFKYTEGSIKVISSSDNLYAYSHDSVGGFFTNVFLDAVDKGYHSWVDVLEESRRVTNRLCVENGLPEQNPKFEIYTNGIFVESSQTNKCEVADVTSVVNAVEEVSFFENMFLYSGYDTVFFAEIIIALFAISWLSFRFLNKL